MARSTLTTLRTYADLTKPRLLPLVLALVWLVTHELQRARNTPVMRAMVSLTPTLLAALTLIIGAML